MTDQPSLPWSVRPLDAAWVRDHPAEAITAAIRLGIDIGRRAAYDEMFAAVRQAIGGGDGCTLGAQLEAVARRRAWDATANVPRPHDWRGRQTPRLVKEQAA